MAKSLHITEDLLNGRKRARAFRVWLGVLWAWPLVVLLLAFHWREPAVVLRLLCKSTWVLCAGVCQSWVLLLAFRRERCWPKWFVPVLGGLTAVSLLLLPFGFAKWEWNASRGVYAVSRYWRYGIGLMKSFLVHLVPVVPACFVYYGPGLGGNVGAGVGSFSGAGLGSGSGLWGKRSWLDDVWSGGQVSDEFYGRRGEFDLNDEARRVSEDMEQFHRNHPDADLSDHFFWEDVLDAETDGYLEE